MTEKFRILMSEPFNEHYSFANAELQVEPVLWQSPELLIEKARHADALLVRNQTKVTEALITACPNLKVVGRLGIGLDNIDVVSAKRHGLPVVYAPEANTNAVAEYCLAQCFNLLRMYPASYASTARDEWNRFDFIGKELSNQTVGLIGFGRNGKLFAAKLHTLGVKVIVHARRPETIPSIYKAVSLDELLATADIVSLHIPGGSETRHLINADTLARMKKGSYLLNAARGSVVDEQALAIALHNGHLAGAALDVREQEPPQTDILKDCPNLLCTAHIASFSKEAETATNTGVLADVIKVLNGETPRFPAYEFAAA